MSDVAKQSSNGRRIGLAVFIAAAAATAAMIYMGVVGIPWPKWLLALTTVL